MLTQAKAKAKLFDRLVCYDTRQKETVGKLLLEMLSCVDFVTTSNGFSCHYKLRLCFLH